MKRILTLLLLFCTAGQFTAKGQTIAELEIYFDQAILDRTHYPKSDQLSSLFPEENDYDLDAYTVALSSDGQTARLCGQPLPANQDVELSSLLAGMLSEEHKQIVFQYAPAAKGSERYTQILTQLHLLMQRSTPDEENPTVVFLLSEEELAQAKEESINRSLLVAERNANEFYDNDIQSVDTEYIDNPEQTEVSPVEEQTPEESFWDTTFGMTILAVWIIVVLVGLYYLLKIAIGVIVWTSIGALTTGLPAWLACLYFECTQHTTMIAAIACASVGALAGLLFGLRNYKFFAKVHLASAVAKSTGDAVQDILGGNEIRNQKEALEGQYQRAQEETNRESEKAGTDSYNQYTHADRAEREAEARQRLDDFKNKNR